MKLRNIFGATLLLATALFAQGCSDSDKDSAQRLTVTKDGTAITELTFSVGNGSQIIAINTDGDWSADVADTTWCKLAVHAGYGYADSLKNSYTRVTVLKNEGDQRSTTLTVRAGNLQQVLTITQRGTGTDAGDTFMSAFTFVENLKIGYNLGNTLESNHDITNPAVQSWFNPKTVYDWETCWGQPQTTQEIIDAIAQKGFNLIRVPVTWFPHMDANDNIEEAWMNRVQEVVDMVLKAGCYCIINVHHDASDPTSGRGDGGNWLVADIDQYDKNAPRFKKIWQQIATHFRDYDDRLVFEGINEIIDEKGNWGDAARSSAYDCVNKLMQDFVTTVRATGGNNEYRNLLINPYSAGSSPAKLAGMTLPTDTHANHLLCSIHSYDPYWFCNDTDDKESQQYYIQIFNDECKAEIDGIFQRIDQRFRQDFGVPYIVGEFGAIGTHPVIAERAKYAQYFVDKFKQYQTTGLWWMGLIDRTKLSWYEDQIATTLVDGMK